MEDKELKERLLRIEDAIIDLATDLEEGNVTTARENAILILRRRKYKPINKK